MDPGAHPDPVDAVLRAHAQRRDLSLRTSGTTGDPRAVRRTTDSWWRSFPAYGGLTGVTDSSLVWVPGPLSATMNLFAAVHARAAGADVATGRRPPPATTHAVLTPHGLAAAAGLPRGASLVVAGDRLSPDAADRARSLGLVVHHYYGASELSFVAWGPHAEDLAPFPGVEVADRDGVLWSRSAFHALDVTGHDGWASVGDRGSVASTADGPRVRVRGRGTSGITTAGATVRVHDVEETLRGAREVGRLVVVGVPHPRLGQVVACVVEDAASAPPLARHARRALDEAARPRQWFHAPVPWPETAERHTDRSRLAALAAAGVLAPVSTRDSGRSGDEPVDD